MNISSNFLVGNTRIVLLAGLALTQKSAFLCQDQQCDEPELTHKNDNSHSELTNKCVLTSLQIDDAQNIQQRGTSSFVDMRAENGNEFHFYIAVQTLARQANINKILGVKQNIQTMGVTEVCRHNLNCIIHTALLGPCRTVNLDSCSNKCCEFQPSSQITASSHRAMNISLKLLIGNTRTVLLAGLALTQKSAFGPQTK